MGAPNIYSFHDMYKTRNRYEFAGWDTWDKTPYVGDQTREAGEGDSPHQQWNWKMWFLYVLDMTFFGGFNRYGQPDR